MRILITGSGCTGKSTFRQIVKKLLRSANQQTLELNIGQNNVQALKQGSIILLEDTFALTPESKTSPQDYDVIFYVHTDPWSHIRFYAQKAFFDLAEDKSEVEDQLELLASLPTFDIEKIPEIVKQYMFDYLNDKAWEKVHQNELAKLEKMGKKVIRVESKRIKGGIRFSMKHENHSFIIDFIFDTSR